LKTLVTFEYLEDNEVVKTEDYLTDDQITLSELRNLKKEWKPEYRYARNGNEV